MEIKSVLITGFFNEQDWQELVNTLRNIESRHPDVLYTAQASDPTLAVDDALKLMRRTFPRKEGETPIIGVINDP